jgi:hypothetical protein
MNSSSNKAPELAYARPTNIMSSVSEDRNSELQKLLDNISSSSLQSRVRQAWDKQENAIGSLSETPSAAIKLRSSLVE